MAVNVNEWVLCPLDVVFRRDQRRLRLVLIDGWHPPVRWALRLRARTGRPIHLQQRKQRDSTANQWN